MESGTEYMVMIGLGYDLQDLIKLDLLSFE